MNNEMLWVFLVLINFGLIILSYKFFGKLGLYVWIGFSIIIANIQVLKTVELFSMVATLGNIIYGTTFLATDILSEKYGKNEAKKAVWVGFFTMISSTFIMWVCLYFVPHSSDFAQDSLNTIFSIMPRITAGSLIAYLMSNMHDVWAYHFWKKKFNKIWIQNNLSTMVSQLIDSSIFVLIAFWGQFETSVLVEIFITTYIIKWVVAFLDTPFIYLATKINIQKE